jgi:hypothetical protein
MRHVVFFVFAIVLFIAVSSAHAFEASCDLRKCMDICRSEYESGCAGMCGRIISLCKQLVFKPERTRNARHANSAHRHIKLDARAGNSLRLIH